MATKAQKQLDRMRAANASRRRKAREGRQKMTKRIALAGGAYAIGTAERNGWLAQIPTLGGMPNKLVLAAGCLVAEGYVGGRAGDALEGVGEAALSVSLYELGKQGSIAGDDSEYIPTAPGVVPALISGDEEDELAAVLEEAEVSGYEDELAAIEGDDEEEDDDD